MELSDSTLKGLSLLGEEAKIPAAAYKELLICVSKDVTSSLETSITSIFLSFFIFCKYLVIKTLKFL